MRPLRALNPPVRMIMTQAPTSILLGAEAPRVLTIPMIAAVLADRRKLRARNASKISRYRIPLSLNADAASRRPAGKTEDRLDLDVKYPRATAEKALLDWLYLGESKYSKIAGPPLDVEVERLDAAR